MQTAPRNHAIPSWGVPLVLAGLVLSLCFGAIPGAPGLALGREEGNAGNAAAALTVPLVWRGVPVGPKTVAPLSNDAALAGAADEVADSIEALLGQLDTSDESTLREALSGMRDAATAHWSPLDAEAGTLVSWWVEEFSTRLAAAIIPAGTRERLTAKLSSWQHGIGASIDGARNVPLGTANVSVSVAPTLENADVALPAEDTNPFKSLWWLTWLLLGLPVAVGVLLASSAGTLSQRSRNVPAHAPKGSASPLHGFDPAI